MRRAYLASIVPVIINAALNEHQLVVDIVAFVAKGDFPRSRLGEKQRGKILASWVTRKMETIAQFSIRDADAADSQITEVPEHEGRSRGGSVMVGSSLKNVEAAPRETAPARFPTGARETPDPAPYESSIVESPPLPLVDDRGSRPTDNTRSHQYSTGAELHLPSPDGPSYSKGMLSHSTSPPPDQYQHYDFSDDGETPLPGDNQQQHEFDFSTEPPDPRYDRKPSLPLPQAEMAQEGDLWTLPSQQQSVRSQREYGDGGVGVGGGYGGAVDSRRAHEGAGGYTRPNGGGLRVANADADDDDEWPQEALRHMDLGGDGAAAPGGANNSNSNSSGGGRERGNRYDGSGYGGGYGSAM